MNYCGLDGVNTYRNIGPLLIVDEEISSAAVAHDAVSNPHACVFDNHAIALSLADVRYEADLNQPVSARRNWSRFVGAIDLKPFKIRIRISGNPIFQKQQRNIDWLLARVKDSVIRIDRRPRIDNTSGKSQRCPHL